MAEVIKRLLKPRQRPFLRLYVLPLESDILRIAIQGHTLLFHVLRLLLVVPLVAVVLVTSLRRLLLLLNELPVVPLKVLLLKGELLGG